MKIKTISTVTFSLLTSFMYGQTKYYQNAKGTIEDSVTHAKSTNDMLQGFKKSFPYKSYILKVVEINKEIRRTKDSLVLTGDLDIAVEVTNVQKSKSIALNIKKMKK